METTQLPNTVSGFDLTKPEETLQLANILKQYLTQQKLTCKIQGKDYVLAEGWMYAGSQLGIIPICQKPTRIFNEGEVKYECETTLVKINTGEKMGYGYAICSNLERNKKSFEEYAIASMAQTRAIAKAYRNLLAWIVKAAGFEATPYEEMEGVATENYNQDKVPDLKINYKEDNREWLTEQQFIKAKERIINGEKLLLGKLKQTYKMKKIYREELDKLLQ